MQQMDMYMYVILRMSVYIVKLPLDRYKEAHGTRH